MLMLGLVVLGPKRLQAMLGHVVRAKAELENATRSIKSQLAIELDATPREDKSAERDRFVHSPVAPSCSILQVPCSVQLVDTTCLMAHPNLPDSLNPFRPFVLGSSKV